MNPFDRGLTVLYALAGLLAALYAGSALAGWYWPGQALESLAGLPGFTETAYALLAVYLLAGVRLFWHGLFPEKKHAVVQDGSLGKVRIALSAIESLVEKVALDQKGIKEAKAGVAAVPRGIGIRVRVSVTPDVSVPEISGAIQNLIRERVLEVTGIEVNEVRVSVENITSQRLRVE